MHTFYSDHLYSTKLLFNLHLYTRFIDMDNIPPLEKPDEKVQLKNDKKDEDKEKTINDSLTPVDAKCRFKNIHESLPNPVSDMKLDIPQQLKTRKPDNKGPKVPIFKRNCNNIIGACSTQARLKSRVSPCVLTSSDVNNFKIFNNRLNVSDTVLPFPPGSPVRVQNPVTNTSSIAPIIDEDDDSSDINYTDCDVSENYYDDADELGDYGDSGKRAFVDDSDEDNY